MRGVFFSQLFVGAVALVAVSLGADTITISSPANGGIAQNMKPSQRFYVELPEVKARELLTARVLGNDLATSVRSQPQGVILSWKFKGDRGNIHYRLSYADNSDLMNAVVIKPPHSRHVLYNLELGKTYYWKVEAVYKDGRVLGTPVNKFTVDPKTPRVMYVPNMDNVRDLGGRRGLEGRMIPQNLIFRSAGFNFNSSDGGKTPGKPQFTEEGRRIIREDMKIRTDLDLRTSVETASMKESPVGPDINFVHISSACYNAIYSESGLENYAKLFRVFCKRENYPIDFHCIAGADRTGSLAFLLLAILGVDRDEIVRDYTFTSFYSLRPHANYDILEKGLDKYGTADESLALKAERYFLRAGITVDEIAAFREIVLGPGLPMSPVMAEAKRLNDLLAGVRGGQCQFTVTPKTETVRLELCGKTLDSPLALPTGAIVKTAGTVGGLTRLLLVNSSDVPLCLFIKPQAGFAEGKYIVSYPLDGELLLSPSGAKRWSKQELEKMEISLEPGAERLLEISGDAAEPTGMKEIKYDVSQLRKVVVTPVETIDGITVDGQVNGDEWKNVVVRPLQSCYGGARADAPKMRLAVNSAHDTLYLATEIKTNNITVVHHNRDGAAWSDDSIEIFLTSVGNDVYYQLVVNADNAFYDGRKQDGKWNIKEFHSATKRTADGWSVEVAIPLKQFDFSTAVEFNLIANILSTDKRRSLYPVGAQNHQRSAMRPVIWK